MQANRLEVGDTIILPEGSREIISLYREFEDVQSFITNDGLKRTFPSTYQIEVLHGAPGLRSVA